MNNEDINKQIEDAAYKESVLEHGTDNDKQEFRKCTINGFFAGAKSDISFEYNICSEEMKQILINIFNEGVSEGETRSGNFEWGIRRKNIDFNFDEWYNDYLTEKNKKA